MASISALNALAVLNLRRNPHISNSLFLSSYIQNPIFAALSLPPLRLPSLQPQDALRRSELFRSRSSVVFQGLSEVYGTEEGDGNEADVGVLSRSDWGQQEEVSDEESVGVDGEYGGGEEELSVPPRQEAKLFIGNLPYEVDSTALTSLFNEAGEVLTAEVIYHQHTYQSRGFGFVSMRTVEEAHRAVEMFNGYELNGRALFVDKAISRGSRPTQNINIARGRRIFVGNLNYQVDDSRLEEFFSRQGKVLKAQVIYDKDTGRSRGFGYIKMSTDEETDDAIASLDGKSLDGRPLRLSVAEERQFPRSPM